MGLIYVNPEGPNGEPGPGEGGPRHPRDVRPDGHERRGDGRADRRRPHVRQDARRGIGRATSAPSRRAAPLEQQGLGWKNTFGTGKGADAITSGLEVVWTPTPTKWDNTLPRDPVQVRVGADQEPGRRVAVAGEGRAGAARCPARSIRRTARPPTMLTTDLALRMDPDLRADRPPVPRAPGGVRRGVRQGLVQAAAPRHGAGLALPRAVGAGAAAVAGPGPGRRSRADRRGRDRRPQAAGARLRAVGRPSWSAPPGRRRRASAAPTSAAAPTAPGSGWSRSGTGRSTSRPSWAPCCRPSSRIQQEFNSCAVRRDEGLARRPDRAGRVRGGRAGGARRRTRHHRPVRAGTHRRDAGADRRRVVRRPRTAGRRVPQLRCRPGRSARRRPCWWTGRTC